jgi:cellulose synthase (UDP-forming)
MAQILRLENPLLIRGLTIPQRLNYFLSITHFFGGIPRLILISAPLVYLLLGWKPFSCDGWSILLYAGPHIFFALAAMSYMSKSHRQSFWSEVFQTATSFFLAPVTLIALISPQSGKFTVTSKRLVNVDPGLNFKFAWPAILMIVISLAAICSIPFTWRSRPGEHTALLINFGWAAHNLVILIAVLLAARNRMQLRDFPRVDLELACNVTAGDRQFGGTITDLSETGGRAVLSNCEKLPNRFAVQIDSSFGEKVDARAKLIWCESAENGQMNCGFSFANLDRDAHHSLIGLTFCDPNRWSVDNRPVDRPLRSYWYIVSSAIRAFRHETPYDKVPAGRFEFRPSKPSKIAVADFGPSTKEIPCTNAQFSVKSTGIEQSHVPTHNLLIAAKLARKASAVGATAGSD